ncbi:MAG: DUF3393 domain-containing protein [Thiotrichales bacterium]|nr:DUF3393 domain-containing protein [Thiotrichales bacterium]
MSFTKGVNGGAIIGSGILLLGASYVTSFHGWLQKQPVADFTNQAQAVLPIEQRTSFRVLSSPNAPSPEIQSEAPPENPVTSLPDLKGESTLGNPTLPEPNKRVPTFLTFTLWQPWLSASETLAPEPDLEPELNFEAETKKVSVSETVSQPVLSSLSSPEIKTIAANPESASASVSKAPASITVSSQAKYLLLEFPETLAQVGLIKKALANLMLSPTEANATDLLSNRKFSLLSEPYYYNRILDRSGHSIRYPAQAYEYSKVLLREQAKWIEKEQQRVLQLRIPLSDKPMARLTPHFESKQALSRLEHYRDLAAGYAEKYQVSLALILAIMQVESAFNPQARSQSNALGLMQIKADAAGRDVYRLLDGENRAPTEAELLDEANNIRIGTAYLSLLRDVYFAQVQNPLSQEMLIVSAYNAGLNRVFALFGATQEQALAQINRLSPAQIRHRLRQEHQTEEARHYLEKVLAVKRGA